MCRELSDVRTARVLGLDDFHSRDLPDDTRELEGQHTGARAEPEHDEARKTNRRNSIICCGQYSLQLLLLTWFSG
jgi:hypothetical protein